MGYLSAYETELFINPSQSSINLAFDFGANKLDVLLNVNDGLWSKEINDITLNRTPDSYNANVSTTFSIKGAFVGDGSKTIGAFEFDDGTDTTFSTDPPGVTAQGVYKAVK